MKPLFSPMNTLAEIEAVVETLPRPQQEMLLRHLLARLRKTSTAGALASWPVPPPNVPGEELRRIGAIIEEEFSRVDDWK